MYDGDFLVRSKEISRVEGLSDAVFGFAITLLVVSLDVPKSAGEVLHAMRGFFAFAITFSILFMVWRTQFQFFRRFGLEDNTTVFLTAVLLFTILFFIYPLKFLFTSIVEALLKHAGYPDPAFHGSLGGADISLLGIAYGLGWASVFGVFSLMYRHAYRQRDKLHLNKVELFDTREAVWATSAASLAGMLIAIMNLLTYVFPKQDAIGYGAMTVVVALAVFMSRRRRGRKARRQMAIESHRQAADA